MTNKNKFISIIGLFFFLVLLISGLYLFLANRLDLNLVVHTKDTDYKITNTQSKATKIISKTTSLKLSKGFYQITPQNKKYDQTPVEVDLKTAQTINLQPALSYDFQKKLYDENEESINQLLNKKYNFSNAFTIYRGTFFDDGNYYAALLELKTDRLVFAKQLFRTLLQKQNDNWHIVIEPNVLLTKFDNPEVPVEIINATNRLDIAR